ncbi:MAG: hypothetical protein ACD_76C00042G0009 [uncultured bacterium]|nr:MAG: hypothetical protein ACD_76C00042G0009 [uncultured bacterium]HBD05463.1 hypothetical protein [Candidatus Uhrbacteria bacterium]
MRQIICFDLWNTLVRSCQGSGSSYADILIRLGANPASIYPIVRDELMIAQLDYEQMAAHLCSRLKLRPTKSDLLEIANNWKRDNHESEWLQDAIQLLKVLRGQDNTLVLITNITWPAWVLVNSKLEVEQYFDYVFLSCCEGLSKPNPRVWQTIEDRDPDTTVAHWMIGDNEADDLSVPATIGWKTILAGTAGAPLAEITQIIHKGGAK